MAGLLVVGRHVCLFGGEKSALVKAKKGVYENGLSQLESTVLGGLGSSIEEKKKSGIQKERCLWVAR